MPGIVLLCDTGLFQAFNRQRGKETLPKTTSQNGGKSRNLAPEPKRRANLPMVPPGGFSRGEQFERERVAPPLSRLLCLLSCRSKKGRPPAGRTSQFDNSTRLNWHRVSIPTSKYHPRSKPQPHRPLAPSVTANAVPAPSRRELWGAYLSTLDFCKLESANCESLSHASGVPAPFSKGASGVPPVAMRTIIFYKSLLPLQCPVTLPGGNRGNAPKPPLPKGGGLAKPNRGDSAGWQVST